MDFLIDPGPTSPTAIIPAILFSNFLPTVKGSVLSMKFFINPETLSKYVGEPSIIPSALINFS